MRYHILIFLCLLQEVYPLFFILGEKETRCFYEEFEDDAMMNFQFNATLGESTSTVGLVVTVLGPNNQKMMMKEYGSHSTVSFKVSEPGEYGMCVGTNSTKWAIYASGKIKVHFQLHTEYSRHPSPEEEDHENEHENENEEKQGRHPPDNKLHQRPPKHDNGKHEVHDPTKKGAKHAEEEDNEEKEDEDEKEGEEKKGGEEKEGDEEHEEHDEDAEPDHPTVVHLDTLEERIHEVQSAIKFITKMQAGQRSAEEKFRLVAETTNFRVVVWAVIQLLILLITGWWQMRSLKSFFIAKKLV